ncbi:MAG: ArdC family protein [Micavibrio sp.]
MTRNDLYTEVTNTIIQTLEQGLDNDRWELPWHGFSDIPQNAITKKLYRGVNVPLLWIFQVKLGYKSGLWATYKQWQEAGAQVRKGEKSAPIVFWKTIETEGENADADAQNTRMFARYSSVFNAEQVDGFEFVPEEKRSEIQFKEECTRFVEQTRAQLEHGHPYACYRTSTDTILMPHPELFRPTGNNTASENYYSTLFHELTHWSGAEKRLDRIKHKKYADQDYAFEELVAELGAAMLCASLGATPCPRADHAQYIRSWLKALGDDKRFIFSAASQAQKAIDYLYAFQGQENQQQEAA